MNNILLKALLVSILVPVSASGAAPTALNLFEAGTIGDWTFNNPSVCPVLINCGGAAGPCISMAPETVVVNEGSGSGLVKLQNDGADTNCLGADCGSYRKLDLNTLPITNWASGYTRVAFDARNGGMVSVDAGLAVSDGVIPSGIPGFTTLAVGSGWTTISIQIQDLIDAGYSLANMTKATIMFNRPTDCASVYIDNLRLVAGVLPAPVTNVAVVPTGISGQLRVSWMPVAGADHYVVYWDANTITNVRNAANSNLAVAGSPYVINGLVDGTEYHVKVAAISTGGDRSAAAPASPADVNGIPGCLQPAGVSVFSLPGKVRVMWPLVPGATNYRVYRQTGTLNCSSIGPASLVADLGNVNLYDDAAVAAGTTYCYIVIPHAGSCSGGCSNTACILYTNSGIAPPSPLGAVSCQDRVRVSYTSPPANPAGTQYISYRMISPDTCANFKMAGTAKTFAATQAYFDDLADNPSGNLVDGTTYYYRLVAVNGPDVSECSPMVAAKYQANSGSCSGVKSATPAASTLTAYPNPVKISEGPVRFDGLSAGMVVEIGTVTGEQVAKHKASSAGLWAWDGKNDSGSTVAAGVYLYVIHDGNRVAKRGKLVISR